MLNKIGLTFKDEVSFKEDIMIEVFECSVCKHRQKGLKDGACEKCKAADIKNYREEEYKVGVL